MKKKTRNLGFTMIEMIVAFAILGVATIGIGGFFVTSARSSSGTQNESALQNEAQLAVNQIERLVIDAGLGVNYKVDDAFVTSDAGLDAASKILYIFNADEEANMNLLLLKWEKASQCIYYQEILNPEKADLAGKDVKDIVIDDTKWDLLAEGVESFGVTIDDVRKKISFSIKFVGVRDSYSASTTVTIRNNVAVNEPSLEKLYDSIDVIVKAKLTGVKIAVTPKILANGVQGSLTHEYVGKGNIEEELKITLQWLVATDEEMNNTVAESAVKVEDGNNISVNLTELKGYEEYHGVLYLQAVATAKEVADETKVTTVESGVVSFKIVEDLKISFTGIDPETEEVLELEKSINEAKIPDNYVLGIGDSLSLDAEIVAEALDDSEKRIVWSINEGAIAKADISADGELTVDKESPSGTFTVRAALKASPNVYVEYPFEIKDGFTSASTLKIEPEREVILRGEEISHKVTLGGEEIDPSECDWVVAVGNTKKQAVTGTPVTVGDTGVVSVLDTLAYESSYQIRVTATYKKNTTIKATSELTVPKVTIDVDTDTENIVPGTMVDDIWCTVTGLKDYQLKWSMAKSGDPNYFFTARGNSNITGYVDKEGIQRAKVAFGSDETTTEYIIVKAVLDGSSIYSDTVKIQTPVIKITGNTEVVRGASVTYKATIGETEGAAVKWSIKNPREGISIDANGTLTVRPDFAWANRDKEYSVTVQAEWNGLETEHVVKIPATTVNMNVLNSTVEAGESAYMTLAPATNLEGTLKVALVDAAGKALPAAEATIEGVELLGFSGYEISVSENVSVESFYVVVYVEGYEAAYEARQITVPQSIVAINSDKAQVNRGGSVVFTMARTGNHQIPNESLQWSIEGSPEGVSIGADGRLVVEPDFAWDSKDAAVNVTVKGTWTEKDLSVTKTVSVNAATFKITPESVDIKSGGTQSFNVIYANIELPTNSGIEWKLNGAATFTTLTKNTDGTATLTVSSDSNVEESLELVAYLRGYDAASASADVTAKKNDSIYITDVTVNRGGKVTLEAKDTWGNQVTGVTWSIVGDTTGLSLSPGGELTIAPNYAWSAKGSAQKITVKASYNGNVDEGTVTVPAATFALSPTSAVIGTTGHNITSQNFILTTTNIDGIDGKIQWTLTEGSSLVTAAESGKNLTLTAKTATGNVGVKVFVDGYSDMALTAAVQIVSLDVYVTQNQGSIFRPTNVTVRDGGTVQIRRAMTPHCTVTTGSSDDVIWTVSGATEVLGTYTTLSSGTVKITADYKGVQKTITLTAK